jgi:hypothetical protein
VTPIVSTWRGSSLDHSTFSRISSTAVVEVEPAQLVAQESVEGCRVEIRLLFGGAPRRLQEVAEGVLEHGAEVVVRSVREHSRRAGERLERAAHALEAVHVTQVVAGVDHQIGLQPRQRPHPLALGALVGCEVQVGEVQDA